MYIKPNHNKRNIKVLDLLGNHSILRWHCLLFTLLCAPSYKVALAFKTGAEVI